MKKNLSTLARVFPILLVLLMLGGTASASPLSAVSVGTGFTYQGRLSSGGTPVNGHCDFQFSLWDASTGGTQIGSTIPWDNVTVTNGLFTVVLNSAGQFGVSAFDGSARFLQIATRCPTGSGSFATLGPRQELTAAPYAMGLMPGTRMLGNAYQTLKVQNNTTQTGVPAGVTGEIMSSVDGVGVYGSNEVYTPGSTGMGVWGRTWSLNGVGVKGTGINGATGVYAESTSGHAIYAENNSTGATIEARNTGTGDIFRALSPVGNQVVYQVTNTGDVGIVGNINVFGTINPHTLGTAGGTPLCRNSSNEIATCSSSLRYKDNIADLNLGLDTVAQLRPVTFDWQDSGAHDLGLVAEEVEKVAPMLTTRNADGQIEGVKYDRLTAVLVNAINEQQDQIAELKSQNAELEARITALEKMSATPARADTNTIPTSWLGFGGLVIVGVILMQRRRGGA